MSETTYGTGASSSQQGTTEQVQEKAQEVVGQAQEKAQELKGQASGQLREQVDQRSTQAGEQLTSLADAMRRTGETLRTEGNDAPARVTDTVAQRAESLGSYLRDADADRILHDVEDFARRQPWVVAAGGLVIGMMAARFMKASSSRRYSSSFDGGRYGADGSGASRSYGGYGTPAGTTYGSDLDDERPRPATGLARTGAGVGSTDVTERP
jgi:ElaB/YqjD/DUF883 family membrane-anchored ribosome-binding protein